MKPRQQINQVFSNPFSQMLKGLKHQMQDYKIKKQINQNSVQEISKNYLQETLNCHCLNNYSRQLKSDRWIPINLSKDQKIKEQQRFTTLNNSVLPSPQQSIKNSKKYNQSKIIKEQKIEKIESFLDLPKLTNEQLTEIDNIKQTLQSNEDELDLTAKCYTLMDAKTCKVLMSHKGKKTREIASLTKIMTCFIACELIKQNKLHSNTVITLSKQGPSMIGTSAQLRPGDQITLFDLLHGMMLPSGNDAALEIAIFIGKYLQENLYQEYSNKNHVQIFVLEMNRFAKHLMLKFTRYANPHGLINKFNRSCTTNQARLSAIAMKNEIFQSIVGKRQFICSIKDIQNNERIQIFHNTNKLLQKKECLGIKTGMTQTAGLSLSSYFNINGKQLAIVVFGTAGTVERFQDCFKIFDFVSQKLGLKNMKK